MLRTLAALFVLIVAGCSKPDATPFTPVAVTPTTPPTAPIPTPAPIQRTTTGEALETKAEIIAALERQGFTLEPFELSAPVAGVSGYRVKGIPAGVAFTEHDGTLREVEAMTLKDKSGKNALLIAGFATIVGGVVTGQPRAEVVQAVEGATSEIGTTPGSVSRTIGAVRLKVTRHEDGGYSFQFVPSPKRGE